MRSRYDDAVRAVRDVGSLVRFRFARICGRRVVTIFYAAGTIGVVTLIAAVAPALAAESLLARGDDVALLLPTAYLAFLAATTVGIVVTGGGRELLAPEEAVAYPVSPATDHLGALLLAPLNLAWLVQAWGILGATAFAVGADGLWAAQITAVVWLFTATAAAQALAWCVEWVRRGPHGLAIIRVAGAGLALLAALVVMTENTTRILDKTPTVYVVIAALQGGEGQWMPWLIGTFIVLLAGVVVTVCGARVTRAVTGRPSRDELRGEVRETTPRPTPTSDLAVMLRIDRASVWRSVPLRRGFLVLALVPGAMAAAGRLDWEQIPLLAGIVAAGGALLFGVNAWCLDGRGALWRDSLPLRPEFAFLARAMVLSEMLLGSALVTMVVAALRAGGVPTSAQIASMLAMAVVVSLQVVARSMHWSLRRPYAVETRSARSAPAPPLMMVTYSTHLAVTSTLTGMLFALTARASDGSWAVLAALPLALLAVRRLLITARLWSVPETRSRVVAVVSSR